METGKDILFPQPSATFLSASTLRQANVNALL